MASSGKVRPFFLLIALAAVVVSASFGAVQAPVLAANHEPPATTPWPGGRWQPGPAAYGVTVVSNVPVMMDDGISLNATIGYPTDLATGQRAARSFPVILQQTPYTDSVVPYFVQHGYIFVSVRSRGTGTSGGTFGYVSARDHQDGVDTLQWAAHQLPGSNGIVGGYGCSYDGETQLYTAANVGPHSPLKAIVPACTAQDYIRETFLIDGIPTGDYPFLKFAARFVGNTPSAQAFFSSLTSNIQSGGEDAYNREFWLSRQPIEDAQRIVANGIPALLWTGWSDVVDRGQTEFYAALQNAYRHRPVFGTMSENEPATGRYQIIVGPWGHGQGLDIGIMLEWYDTWLKGRQTGIEDTHTPMHLYELNSNRWINTAHYPIASDYSTYYLDSGATLSDESSSGGASDSLTWAQPGPAGTILTYTTQPFAGGTTLAGPTSATVYASSSNTNMELIAQLFDIAPDTAATRITFGAVLGSQEALDPTRNWYDENGKLIRPYTSQFGDQYLTPREIQRFDVALHPRLWSVLPGHSLRLVLTTQTPSSVCNGPVAANIDPCFLTDPQQQTVPGGVYEIQRNRAWPSSVNLPLLPYLFFQSTASGVTPTSNGQVEPLDWDSKVQKA
jgi:uncharacterized protein